MCRIILLAVLGLIYRNDTSAQLCQGSLGEPIVNITFGSGSNPGAPLPGATTNYQYYSSDCPNDGFYSVRNSTVNCFTGSWHTLTSDHTGNGNGYFMLVNSSFQPSAFYIDTVDLLCSSTTYEFAAWIMNVSMPSGCSNNPIRPNLTFNIERLDGTILQTYSTGNISTQPSPTWNQYGFFFNTPANLSRVVLRLINNAPGGCGNDLALDDITFRPCGPPLNPSINGSTSTQNLCAGQAAQYTLSCQVTNYTNPYVQWQQSSNNGSTWSDIPGANTTTVSVNFTPTTPVGTYQYRATVSEAVNLAVSQCRVASAPLAVKVNDNPVTSVSNNGPVCEGGTVTLTASGGTAYTWIGPNAFVASAAAISLASIGFSQAGKYYVEVTNAFCKKIDSTDVVVRSRPTAIVSVDTLKLCEGDSLTLSASGGINYTWLPTIGLSSSSVPNPKVSPVQSTNYKVIVSDQFSCTDTASVQVSVFNKPIVSAGPDKVIAEGQSIRLQGSVAGAATYVWSPAYNINDVTLQQPLVNPVIDTAYTLSAQSTNGCGSTSDIVRVQVFKKLVIPNAFSPNGDGINDSWTIPALQAYPGFYLSVFNRFGQLVYQSRTAISWDGKFKGKLLPAGVYYYIIDVKNNMPKQSNWLMLIR